MNYPLYPGVLSSTGAAGSTAFAVDIISLEMKGTTAADPWRQQDEGSAAQFLFRGNYYYGQLFKMRRGENKAVPRRRSCLQALRAAAGRSAVIGQAMGGRVILGGASFSPAKVRELAAEIAASDSPIARTNAEILLRLAQEAEQMGRAQ